MIIRLILQLEILFVNLFITNKLSKRKYSKLILISSLLGYTVLIVFLFATLRNDDSPLWLSLLIGISYILPLILLYKETPQRIISTMLFCWTQTLIISNLSRSISILLNANELTHIIIQSLILIVVFFFILKFSFNIYKVILEDISKDSIILMMILSIFLFSLAVIFGYFLKTPPVLAIILSLILAIISVAVYLLLRNFVEKSKKVIALNDIVFKDSLTKIENRLSLHKSMDNLIQEKQPFECFFMDLNDLKGVNDTYGHYMGDQYIIEFTKAVVKSLMDNGNVYRLSGDEFVCLTQYTDVSSESLMRQISTNFEFELQFRGVSIGKSFFPDDAKTQKKLLEIADERMYNIKQEKPQNKII